MNISELLHANCRVEGMWLIPSPCPHDEFKSEMEMNFPEELEELAQGFGWSDDEMEDLKDGDRDAWDALFDQMINADKHLWVIKVSTPVYDGRSGGMSYSWGHYHTHQIVTADVDEGLEKALAWAENQYDQAKIKSEAAA